MAIRSHAFGRVTLTDEDAAKFDRQVRYGRASAAAKESVKRGLDMNEAFRRDGKVIFTVKKSPKAKSVAS
jgi:hypothetical protein